MPRTARARRRRSAAGLERERHIGERDAPGQQPVVLKHVADAFPMDRPGRILAEDAHRARIGRDQPGREVEQRRLAGAGGTEDRHHLGRRQVEAHPAQDLERLAVGAGNRFETLLNQRAGGPAACNETAGR